MEAIEQNRLACLTTLHSEQASKEEKEEVLKSVIWYSTEYLLLIKNYPERFKWLLNKKVIENGFLSQKSWRQATTDNIFKTQIPHSFVWTGESSLARQDEQPQPDKITLDEFKSAAGTGFSFEVVRLNPINVKKILEMPLEDTNLLKLFQKASPGKQQFALTQSTREECRHALPASSAIFQ